MTSHELARKLLDGPNLPICSQDGQDPSDPQEIGSYAIVNAAEQMYWNGSAWITEGEYISV